MPKATTSFEERILAYVSTAPIDAVEVTLKFANAAFKNRRARQNPVHVTSSATAGVGGVQQRKKPGPKPGTTRKSMQTAPSTQPVPVAETPVAQAGD